jgi:low density lipoprotein-related protein 2
MYWSDWGENATIERAGMDGKNRTTFLSDNIKWPNGLALDYPTSRIYWTDAGIHTIEYVGFDGKGRTVLSK